MKFEFELSVACFEPEPRLASIMLGVRSVSINDASQARTPAKGGLARNAMLQENRAGAMTGDAKSRKAGKTPLVPRTVRKES